MQLQLGFNPWPGTSICHRRSPKKKDTVQSSPQRGHKARVTCGEEGACALLVGRDGPCVPTAQQVRLFVPAGKHSYCLYFVVVTLLSVGLWSLLFSHFITKLLFLFLTSWRYCHPMCSPNKSWNPPPVPSLEVDMARMVERREARHMSGKDGPRLHPHPPQKLPAPSKLPASFP